MYEILTTNIIFLKKTWIKLNGNLMEYVITVWVHCFTENVVTILTYNLQVVNMSERAAVKREHSICCTRVLKSILIWLHLEYVCNHQVFLKRLIAAPVKSIWVQHLDVSVCVLVLGHSRWTFIQTVQGLKAPGWEGASGRQDEESQIHAKWYRTPGRWRWVLFAG